jgi:hypothetical protein
MALPDGDTWADEALRQEQEAQRTLSALAGLGPDTGEFDSLAERLTAQVRKHVAYEAQVFLRIRETMPATGREKLGRRSRGVPDRPVPPPQACSLCFSRAVWLPAGPLGANLYGAAVELLVTLAGPGGATTTAQAPRLSRSSGEPFSCRDRGWLILAD